MTPQSTSTPTRPGPVRGGWRNVPLTPGLPPEILAHHDEAAHSDGFAPAFGLRADAESCLLARVADAPTLCIATGAAAVALLPAPGARRVPVAQRVRLAGSAHSCGILAAGHYPQQSVVDRDGRVLPRSSRLNPALPVCAWSLRVTAAPISRRTASCTHGKSNCLS